MIVVRIVSVRTGGEVSRATLGDDGTIQYSGSDTASAVVRSRVRDLGETETQAITALSRDGWSNGYLMVELPTR